MTCRMASDSASPRRTATRLFVLLSMDAITAFTPNRKRTLNARLVEDFGLAAAAMEDKPAGLVVHIRHAFGFSRGVAREDRLHGFHSGDYLAVGGKIVVRQTAHHREP